MPISFEWDPEKAATNVEKHGVTFEVAQEAFSDFFSITIEDFEHSEIESRFVTIGATKGGKLPVVIHTDRDDSIRIISAWEPSPSERRQYEER